MDRDEEKNVVVAAAQGDPGAFGGLYERYYATMVWLAYAVVLDRDWAEDVAQQTFVKACEKLADLKQPERFAGWLTQICRNTARQALRECKRRNVETAEQVAPVQDCLADQEQREAVKAAIDQLPPMYREIVVLHYYHHQSYVELRENLGISDHSVRGRLFRARKKIEQYLTIKGFGHGQTT